MYAVNRIHRFKSKPPGAVVYDCVGRLFRLNPAATYSPRPTEPSTIGAEGLNGRVRNGNGWFPLAVATGNLLAWSAPGGALDRSRRFGESSMTDQWRK